jgi:hypothetical protein
MGKFTGKKFATCYNNGVHAIAPIYVAENAQLHFQLRRFLEEEHLRDLSGEKKEEFRKKIERILKEISFPQKPIFTFSALRPEEKEKNFYCRCMAEWKTSLPRLSIFTGLHEHFHLLRDYIIAEGGRITDGLYVPFSNGSEWGAHGTESMISELRHITTEQEFRDVFDVNVDDLASTSRISS